MLIYSYGAGNRESKRSGKHDGYGAGRPGLNEAEGVKRQATAKGAHETTEKGKEEGIRHNNKG